MITRLIAELDWTQLVQQSKDEKRRDIEIRPKCTFPNFTEFR